MSLAVILTNNNGDNSTFKPLISEFISYLVLIKLFEILIKLSEFKKKETAKINPKYSTISVERIIIEYLNFFIYQYHPLIS